MTQDVKPKRKSSKGHRANRWTPEDEIHASKLWDRYKGRLAEGWTKGEIATLIAGAIARPPKFAPNTKGVQCKLRQLQLREATPPPKPAAPAYEFPALETVETVAQQRPPQQHSLPLLVPSDPNAAAAAVLELARAVHRLADAVTRAPRPPDSPEAPRPEIGLES